MIQTISLLPGVTLRCFPDNRFKQECLTVQFVRPMDRAEAAMNALLPAVLLRGTVSAPDLKSISLRLDDLYGAGVSDLVRRIGDFQTTGLSCNFIADRYTLDGESLLAPVLEFLGQLLTQPVTDGDGFRRDYTESEKKNLISAIEAARNNKRTYVTERLLQTMCRDDSFGIPRLGFAEDVAAIDEKTLYAHYRRVLAESPVEIFYVGQSDIRFLADFFTKLFSGAGRHSASAAAQTPFSGGTPGEHRQEMDIAQAKLALGYVTDVTTRDSRFAAMQVCSAALGGGMTSRLFTQIREKQSLCYDIGSSYYGSKGILVVYAGIDAEKKAEVCRQIEKELAVCQAGALSDGELEAAKQSLLSSLRTVHDTPSAIENYYATGALSGLRLTIEQYRQAVAAVTHEDIAAVAQTLRLHTAYSLEGVR